MDSILSLRGDMIVYLRAGTEFEIPKEEVEYIDHKQLGLIEIRNQTVNARADLQQDRESEKPRRFRVGFFAGDGAQFFTLTNMNVDNIYVGPQLDLGGRFDWNPKFSVRLGLSWYYNKLNTVSWHESTFIDNWNERPSSIINVNGWRQEVTFHGMELYADAMYNPFGRDSYKIFGLYCYAGLGVYTSWHKDTFSNGEQGWFPHFGIYPTWQFGIFGLWADASCEISSDARLGYSENNTAFKIGLSVGICFLF